MYVPDLSKVVGDFTPCYIVPPKQVTSHPAQTLVLAYAETNPGAPSHVVHYVDAFSYCCTYLFK